jgi:hypothetical protein
MRQCDDLSGPHSGSMLPKIDVDEQIEDDPRRSGGRTKRVHQSRVVDHGRHLGASGELRESPRRRDGGWRSQ